MPPRIPAAEYRRINEAATAGLASGSDYTDEFELASTSSSTASNGSGAPADVGDQHGEQMKAVVFDQYGPPDVLRVEQVPVPTLGAGQVLVEVEATSANLSDGEGLRGGAEGNHAARDVRAGLATVHNARMIHPVSTTRACP